MKSELNQIFNLICTLFDQLLIYCLTFSLNNNLKLANIFDIIESVNKFNAMSS